VVDNFWMEDKVRVEWEEGTEDYQNIFQGPEKPAPDFSSSFVDSQIRDFMLKNAQDPRFFMSDTGSQYLDKFWMQKNFKIHPRLTRIDVSISLN
jgi:hypothetical protein